MNTPHNERVIFAYIQKQTNTKVQICFAAARLISATFVFAAQIV